MKSEKEFTQKPQTSILGCGWLGVPLALGLIEKGHIVYGSTTSESRLSELKQNGIRPFLIDISDKDVDISDFLLSDILVIAVTSKSIESFKNLIYKIEKSQLRKVLFISSTSVYPNTNGIVTEKTETNNSALSEIEKLFISNSFFESTVVRFGGLFGYSRKPGRFIKSNKIIDNPEGYINFIHQDDCIRIVEQIIEKNIWDETLNACCDDHPSRREFYTTQFKKLGREGIRFNEQADNNYKIVSNKKMKELLNYKFRYNDLMNY